MRRMVLFAVVVGACRPSEAVAPSTANDARTTTEPATVGEPNGGNEPTSPREVEAASSPPLAIAAEEEDPVEPSDGALVPLESGLDPIERPSLPDPSDPVRPSRIKAGEYQCKISRGYRFRPCTVTIDEHGRSILTVPTALLAIEGVLTDEGKATRFDGIMTRERPFGCFSCQERCSIDPSSCACKELPREHSADCVMQPIRFTLEKKDGQWRGRVEHHLYHGDEDPEGRPQYETNRYVFVMRR